MTDVEIQMPDLPAPVETWTVPNSELSTLTEPVLNENKTAMDESLDAPELKRKHVPEIPTSEQVPTWTVPNSELSTLPEPVLNENKTAMDESLDAPELKRKHVPEIPTSDKSEIPTVIRTNDRALHACGSLLSQAMPDKGKPPTQEDAGARASKRGRATPLFDLMSPPVAQQPRHMPVLPEVEMLGHTPTDKPKTPVNGWWHATEDGRNGAEASAASAALSMYPRASPQLATYMTDDASLQMPLITPMARAQGEPSRRPHTSNTPMLPALNYSLLDSPFSLADMMDTDELSFHHEHMLSAPEPLPQEWLATHLQPSLTRTRSMPDLKTAVPTLQLLHQEAARRLSLRAPMLVDSFMHDMAWFDYPKTVDHLQNTPAIAQSLPEQHRRRLFADSKQTTATAAASVPPAPGTSPPPCGTVTPPPGGTPSHAINAVATNTDSNEKKQQAPAPLVAEAMPLSKRLLCNMGEAGEPLSDEVTSPYKLTCVATAAVLKTEFVSAFASAAQPASPASRRPASMTEEEPPESPESPFGACFARPPRQRRAVKAAAAAPPLPLPQTAAVATPADACFGSSWNGEYADAGSPSGEELRGSQQWSRDTSPTPVEMAEAMSTPLPPNDLLNSLLREMKSSDPELAAWRSVVNAVNASAQMNAPRNNHPDEGHSRSRTASIMVPTASMLGSASYATPPLRTTTTTTKTRAKPEPQIKPKPSQNRASPVKSVGSHAAADPIMRQVCKARPQEVTIPAVPVPPPALTPPLTAKVPTKARTKPKAKAKAKPVQSGVDTTAVEPLDVDTYARKDHSLIEICVRMLHIHEGHAAGCTPVRTVAIASMSTALNVKRRRIYDIVNVLQGLRVTTRCEKGYYRWNGTDHLVEFLEELHMAAIGVNQAAAKAAAKAETAKPVAKAATKAETAKPVAKETNQAGRRAAMVTALARWRMEQEQQSEETDENAAPCNRQPNTTVTLMPPRSLVHVHGQQLPKGVLRRVATASEKNEMSSDKVSAASSAQRTSSMQGKRTQQQRRKSGSAQQENGKEQAELGLCALTKSFIQLFLATMELSGDEKPELQFEMCASVLLGDSKKEPAKRSRRLYDVVNVLLAIKLIDRGPGHSHRLPTYKWLGLESVGTYFNRVASGAQKSPFLPGVAAETRKKLLTDVSAI